MVFQRSKEKNSMHKINHFKEVELNTGFKTWISL